MLKIRLSRKGRKNRPFYWFVVTDIRSPRDGRFIEKLGTYDPLQPTRVVDIKGDLVMRWMFHGAQLTKTVRNLLSSGGILLAKHLIEGLKRHCIDKEVAHKRFLAWEKMVAKRKSPHIKFVSSVALTSLIDNVEIPEGAVVKAVSQVSKKGAGKRKKTT